MTSFLDGPAAGHVMELRRAPLFLRVAVGSAGTVDALDQLQDRPATDETLYAYRRVAKQGHVRICTRDHKTGESTGGTFALATYRLVEVQPSQEAMRDTVRWRTWATEQAAAEREVKAP